MTFLKKKVDGTSQASIGPLPPPRGRCLGEPESEALRLWYEEALQGRRDAVQVLDELRARAGTFLTVIALTTTFLVALSTTRTSTSIADRPLELAALALFGLGVVSISFVLTPWFMWHFYARPGLMRRMVERGLTTNEILEARARKIPKDLIKDMGRTKVLQWLFILGIASFVAEVICWALSIL